MMPLVIEKLLFALSVIVQIGIIDTAKANTTKVIIQNNTTHRLDLLSTSRNLSKNYWTIKDQSIPPGARRVVYVTSREEGITRDKTFHIETRVRVREHNTEPKDFYLRLKLRGQWPGSHMWQSVRDQAGKKHDWHDDRKKRNVKWKVAGKTINVKYWAFFTVGFDDVEYVFQEQYTLPIGANKTTGKWYDNHLNVLSWNVFMQGIPMLTYQTGRAKMIAPKVRGYDVIGFNEVFDHDGEDILREAMKRAGYKHQTSVLGRHKHNSKPWNGGVMIVSKHQIVATDEKYYGDVCKNGDCNADKGIVYAKINKKKSNGQANYFHVFSSHTDAGSASTRNKQFEMMSKFIRSKNIPKTESIIMMGDFNVNKCSEWADKKRVKQPNVEGAVHRCLKTTDAYNTMLEKLNAIDLPHKGYRFSHDGRINDLTDGSTSIYDYVLIGKAGRKTTEASFTETRMLRHSNEWHKLETDKMRWDISDHFAVYGNLHFVNKIEPWQVILW